MFFLLLLFQRKHICNLVPYVKLFDGDHRQLNPRWIELVFQCNEKMNKRQKTRRKLFDLMWNKTNVSWMSVKDLKVGSVLKLCFFSSSLSLYSFFFSHSSIQIDILNKRHMLSRHLFYLSNDRNLIETKKKAGMNTKQKMRVWKRSVCFWNHVFKYRQS